MYFLLKNTYYLAILCDCLMNGYELSVANPSILCDCLTSCQNGQTHVISGGIDNLFTIVTPICPASFYAGFTSVGFF